MPEETDRARVALGVKLLAAFFFFGATMCLLTIVLLARPGTVLDKLWRLNPEAQANLRSLGGLAILMMAVVGSACALAAFGLARKKLWAPGLAIIILALNLAGDLINAVVRRDFRTLVGLPIAGGLIWYLVRVKSARERGDMTQNSER